MNLTHQPPRLPELLAPAGSPEALEAAIAAGADAVYLGGSRFNDLWYMEISTKIYNQAMGFGEEKICLTVTYLLMPLFRANTTLCKDT